MTRRPTAAQRAHYAANATRRRAQAAEYRAANPEKIRTGGGVDLATFHEDQAATEQAAIRHRARWSAAEDALVLDVSVPMMEIAFRLGRTWAACSFRRQQLRKSVAA